MTPRSVPGPHDSQVCESHSDTLENRYMSGHVRSHIDRSCQAKSSQWRIHELADGGVPIFVKMYTHHTGKF